MANVPSWFEAPTYFNNKLASLKGIGWDSLQLKAAFTNAGYNADSAESLYAHFIDYGNNEGMSPNTLFDADQYLYNKAASFYSDAWQVNDPAVTPAMIESMRIAMGQSGMTPWDHYMAFGAQEGVNPSADFDTDKYIKAKVDKMNADKHGGKSDWTYVEVMDAISSDGMTPLTHYYMFGQNENLGYKPGTAGNIPGTTQYLTEYRDTLYGTVGNDQFHGLVAGDLNDGDYIDGGLGYDTVKAVVGDKSGQVGSGGNIASQPTMVNVEKVVLQAQLKADASDTDSNLGDKGVHIDAGKIQGKIHNNLNPDFAFMDTTQGLQYLGNDDSRTDLIVENVRSYTTDMTIGWFNADPNSQGSVNYEVYFDSQYLKSEDQSTSGTLQIKLMDIMANSEGKGPLLNNPFNVFKFTYTPSSGTAQKIELEFKTPAQYTGAEADYDSLLLAFQTALKDSGLDSVIKAELGTIYKSTYIDDDNLTWSGQGQHIVLSSTNGTVTAASWDSTGEVPGDGVYETRVSSGTSESCPLIYTSVELDNVGHVQWTDAYENCLPDEAIFGSESGTLLIGAHDNRSGIERFDVVVDRGSWITELKSTNNTLRAVTVNKGDINGDGESGNLKWQANDTNVGELFIGASQETDAGSMGYWTVKPALLATNGLTDVKYFDASGYEGHLNIGAQLTAASYNKYMADVDGLNTVHQGFAPGGNFAYTLGANHDILNMTVDSGLAADVEFRLNIDGGAGDDLINFAFTGAMGLQTGYPAPTARNYIQDSAKLRNVTIDGGEGKDTIWSWGHGAVTVKDGAGNDRIYVGQDGDAQVAAGNDPAKYDAANAIWVFNTDPAHKWVDITAAGAQADKNNFLATDDNAAFANAGAANSGAPVYVQVNFKGFTHFVQIEKATVGANGSIANISTRDINNAIMKTITSSEVLDATLVAKEGAGYGLIVESKIDGKMTVDDLDISFFVSKDNGKTKTFVDNTTDEYMTQFGTDTGTNVSPPNPGSDFADRVGYNTGHAEVLESFKLDLSSVLGNLSEGEYFNLTVDGTVYSAAITKEEAGNPQKILQKLASGSKYLFASEAHKDGLFSIKGITGTGVVSVEAQKAANDPIHQEDKEITYSYSGKTFFSIISSVGTNGDPMAAPAEEPTATTLTFTFSDALKDIEEGDIIKVSVGGKDYFATATATMVAGTKAGNEELVKALATTNGINLVSDSPTEGSYTFTSSTNKNAVITHNVDGPYTPTATDQGSYYSAIDFTDGTPKTTTVDVTEYKAGHIAQYETFTFKFEIDTMKVGDIFTFGFKGKTYTSVITKEMLEHTAEAAQLIVTSLRDKDGGTLVKDADFNITSTYDIIDGRGTVVVKAKEAVTTPSDFDVTSENYVQGFKAVFEKANVSFNAGGNISDLSIGETYTLAFTDEDGTITEYKVTVDKDMYDAMHPTSGLGDNGQKILLGLSNGGKLLFGDNGLYAIKEMTGPGAATIEAKDTSTTMFNGDLAMSAGYEGTLGVKTNDYSAAAPGLGERVFLEFTLPDLANLAEGDIVSLTIGDLTLTATVPVGGLAANAAGLTALLDRFTLTSATTPPLPGESLGNIFNYTVAPDTTGNVTLEYVEAEKGILGSAGNAGSSASYINEDGLMGSGVTVSSHVEAVEAVAEEFTVSFTNLDKMSVGDWISVKFDGQESSVPLTQEMLAGTPEALVTLIKALGFLNQNVGFPEAGGDTFGTYNIIVDESDPYKAVIRAPKAEDSGDKSGDIGLYNNGTSYFITSNSDASFGDLQGTDTGTYSVNRVDVGLGDDVIVLNAGSHLDTTLSPVDNYLVNDTLVISGDFGNDDVFNFQTGIDKVEFNVGIKTTITTGMGAQANAATAQGIFNAGVAAAASSNSVGYMQIGSSSEYVFFKVENDSTAAVTTGEIHILGTFDLAEGTSINIGDITFA